jgi:hypothetical protein
MADRVTLSTKSTRVYGNKLRKGEVISKMKGYGTNPIPFSAHLICASLRS